MYNYLADLTPGTKSSTVATMIMNLPLLGEQMVQRGVLADSTAVLQFVDWRPRTRAQFEQGILVVRFARVGDRQASSRTIPID